MIINNRVEAQLAFIRRSSPLSLGFVYLAVDTGRRQTKTYNIVSIIITIINITIIIIVIIIITITIINIIIISEF